MHRAAVKSSPEIGAKLGPYHSPIYAISVKNLYCVPNFLPFVTAVQYGIDVAIKRYHYCPMSYLNCMICTSLSFCFLIPDIQSACLSFEGVAYSRLPGNELGVMVSVCVAVYYNIIMSGFIVSCMV